MLRLLYFRELYHLHRLPLYIVSDQDNLVTFGGVCGVCPIPRLTLVVLIILKLTCKRRLSIIFWETSFEVWWFIISGLGQNWLTIILQIRALDLAHSLLFMGNNPHAPLDLAHVYSKRVSTKVEDLVIQIQEIQVLK